MSENIYVLPPEVIKLIHPPADVGDSRVAAEMDRGRVVLGASLIDELLETVLIRAMLVSDKDAGLLFDPDRPLGAFGTRIRLAQLTGLLDNDFISALRHVQKLRNLCAHRTETIRLTISPFKDHLDEIIRLTLRTPLAAKVLDDREARFGQKPPPWFHYVLGVAFIQARLREIGETLPARVGPMLSLSA